MSAVLMRRLQFAGDCKGLQESSRPTSLPARAWQPRCVQRDGTGSPGVPKSVRQRYWP